MIAGGGLQLVSARGHIEQHRGAASIGCSLDTRTWGSGPTWYADRKQPVIEQIADGLSLCRVVRANPLAPGVGPPGGMRSGGHPVDASTTTATMDTRARCIAPSMPHVDGARTRESPGPGGTPPGGSESHRKRC